MKLTREEPSGLNLITAYDAQSVSVNRQRYSASLIVAPGAVREGWAAEGFEALSAEQVASILALQPSLVLLGTGERQRFPAPALLRPLIEAKVGFEVMATGAACRTYNLLASEGRQVVAALLLDGASPAQP